MATQIWELDGQGNFNELATYTCEPKAALIAHRMQEQHNWNTWAYPKDMADIVVLPMSKRFAYYTEGSDGLTATYAVPLLTKELGQ